MFVQIQSVQEGMLIFLQYMAKSHMKILSDSFMYNVNFHVASTRVIMWKYLVIYQANMNE